MKKLKIFVFVTICLFVFNVKADMGPPSIPQHDVIVTIKDGAQCYERSDGKFTKTKVVIPYNTTLSVYSDIEGSYIYVNSSKNEEYDCYVRYSDVSSKTQKFDMDNKENVTKITPVKAIVLAKGGLNLRKGPSVTYSKIITVPQYSVVTLSYESGTYWYYATYNNQSGWITSMDNYIGIDENKVLYSPEKINIYDSNNKVIGKIPANTEITNYLCVTKGQYYVIYNGIKGYITDIVYYKVDSPGKIKLLKDYDIKEDGKLKKKITANQELEYTMVYDNAFYVPEKKYVFQLTDDDFEYITIANISVKKTGYIGEGLYGEKKGEYKIEGDPTPVPSNEENNQDNKKQEDKKDDNKLSTKDIIIICLLGGIFLALIAIVIIKLANNKNKKTINKVNRNSLDNDSSTIEINNEKKE